MLVLTGFIAAPVVGEASETGRAALSSPTRPNRVPLSAPGPKGAAASAHPCGAQSSAAIAGVDARVAQRIYAGELAGRETVVDQAHIRQSRALLSALSTGNPAAIYAAVHSIVYTPHWHIVRLRVLRAGRVIADVGGPDVVAPVSGVLRQHGRTLGRYVMSVQDDIGYVKLVSRFIGVPVDLYRGRSFLMGTLQPAPALPRSESAIVAGGSVYQARVFTAGGFPAGALNVALLVPAPPRSLSSMSCPGVLAGAWGSVAMHIAARYTPLSAHYRDLVGVVKAATGASAFVMSGPHELAGGSLPGRLPISGTMSIHGRSRAVFSWVTAPRVRVYVVTPG